MVAGKRSVVRQLTRKYASAYASDCDMKICMERFPLAFRSGSMNRMRIRDIQQHHTYADYLTWSATSGNEVIDGVAYVGDPPAPSRLHQDFVVELSRQVTTSLLDTTARAYFAPFDVRLPRSRASEDDQIDTVVQPDLLIAGDLQKLDERGMRGAPDWIAEVLAPATASYDRITKLRAYERADVPEVWLIDPIDRTVRIHRMADGRLRSRCPASAEGPDCPHCRTRGQHRLGSTTGSARAIALGCPQHTCLRGARVDQTYLQEHRNRRTQAGNVSRRAPR